MSTPDDILAAAIAAHQAGRLEEAAEKYQQVLQQQPRHADALHFYGLLHFHCRQGIDAVRLIMQSLDCAPANPHAWNNLGNILLAQDKGAEAREAYRRVTLLAPSMAEAWFNLGICLRDAGEFDAAVEHLRTAIRQQPDFTRAYDYLGRLHYRLGQFDEAASVFSAWLAREPSSPFARHMVAATSGTNVPERADSRFVADLFDRSASSFDRVLRGLSYRAPEVVSATLAGYVPDAARTLDILDAGCGTGLCGPLLRPLANRLVGVDLSENMLDYARRRGSYDELVVAELCEFMSSRPRQFDVVVAADTLEYFGNLASVHRAAHEALRPGGLWLFTVEALPPDASEPYQLLVHGRYAHNRSYVQQSLETAGFEVLELRSEVLRMERLQEVAGFLIVARSLAVEKPAG